LFFALAGLFWRFLGKYGGKYYGDFKAWFGACRGTGLPLFDGAAEPTLCGPEVEKQVTAQLNPHRRQCYHKSGSHYDSPQF